jgi:hypothetical protein
MPHSITLGPGSVRGWRLGPRMESAMRTEYDLNSRVLRHPVNAQSQKSFAWVRCLRVDFAMRDPVFSCCEEQEGIKIEPHAAKRSSMAANEVIE